MSLLDYFRISKIGTASVAKERLQILVAHERSSRNQPSYLPQLQKELLESGARPVQKLCPRPGCGNGRRPGQPHGSGDLGTLQGGRR